MSADIKSALNKIIGGKPRIIYIDHNSITSRMVRTDILLCFY